MSDVETVKVVHNDGYAIINAGDYNDKIHQLYIEKGEEKEPEVSEEPVKKEQPKKKGKK